MTTRAKAIIVAIVTIVVFLACMAIMTLRISSNLRAHPPSYFIFQEITGTDFGYAGRHVSFTDKVVDNIPYLTLSYGNPPDVAVKDILVSRRAKQDLPGLADHTEWLRVLRFIDATGMRTKTALDKVAAGEMRDRLVVVTKSTRPGVNQDTWGDAWKKDWEFDFYELQPDGTISHERLGYPTTKMGEALKPNELRQESWQYTAALHLMPKGGPTINFDKSPIEAAGWTLPVAALCGVVLLGCVVAAYRPRNTASP
jgi:hypothetical protein